MLIWTNNPEEQERKELDWEIAQWEFKVKHGLFKLRGSALRFPFLTVVEEPYIAALSKSKRIDNTVFVKSLYAFMFEQKGVTEDAMELCIAIAIVRVDIALQKLYAKLEPTPREPVFEFPANMRFTI
jgi:hypothetical protein